MAKGRYFYLDNLCGILIIHMIFIIHLAPYCDIDNFAPFPYIRLFFSFFMSWFFFKSGMFFKKESLKQTLIGSTRRLLVPYLLFNFIGAFFEYIYLIEHNNLFDAFFKIVSEILYDESPFFSLANWFLLSLFICRIIYSILIKIKIPSICIFFFSLLIAFYLYYRFYIAKPDPIYINIKGKNLLLYIPYYIGNIFHGLACYSAGHLLKEKQFNRYILLLSLVLFLIHFIYPSILGVRSNSCDKNYFLGTIYNLSGIIVFNNIFYRFFNKKIGLLSYVGQNSMVYYVTHYIVLSVIFHFIIDINNISNRVVLFGIMVIILSTFLYIFDLIFKKNPKIRFLIGK